MAQSLRELLLSLKVKVDKTAIKETDLAFDHASKSAGKFEQNAAAALTPLRKIGEQLDANARKVQNLAARLAAVMPALLPAGALPGTRPEAPSDRRAREMRNAFGLAQGPQAPRPGQSLAAPDVSAFLAPEAAPDFRTGPQRALSRVREGFAELRRSGEVALAQTSAAVDRFNARFDGTVKAIFNARTAFAGLAAVAAGAAIVHFVGGVVEAGAEIHTMAQRTRMSAETLQVWRGVASGVNADAGAVTSAFQRLSRAIAGAAKGGKAQAAAFKDLGVEVKGRNTEDVLIDVGSALAAMEDDAKASALAVQLLGPAGAALVPAFKDGSAAVRKLTAELRENVAMNGEEAARLEEVGSAVERAGKKWTALKTRAIVLLLPVLEAVSQAFEKSSKWILRMAKETSTLQTIFVAISGGALVRVVTMLAAWVSRVGGARAAIAAFGQGLQTAAGFAFRFLLPLLLIEDFLTFLSGGKSVFGRAFEEIFGPGGAQSVREGILAVLTEVSNVLTGSVVTALRDIGNSEFFKGGAKLAAEGVLAILHAIGLALADNEQKAEALAKALRKNLEALGLAPSQEQVSKTLQGGLPENAPKGPPGITERGAKLIRGIFGSPFDDPNSAASRELAQNNALMAKRQLEQQGIVPAPSAPPTPKTVTLNDQRKIEVNVGSNATPGATGRAVGGSVDEALTKDRRQTMNAL